MTYNIDNQGTTWTEIANALQRVMKGERPEALDGHIMTSAIGASLLTREEQTRPCPACGHRKHDFSYWRVTVAGKLLINAFNDREQNQ